MDLAAAIPPLQDPLTRRIYALFDDRQRKAIEVVEPYAVGSATGSVRTKNEDVGLVVRWRTDVPNERDLDIGIVCDGMGGMQHGRFAAQLAASVFVGQLLKLPRHFPLPQRMERGVRAAQRAVYEQLRGDGGTTLSALCFEGSNGGCLAHVGDSRIYEIDAEGRLNQLSRDDTLGAALNREGDDNFDFGRLIQYVGMPSEGDDAALEPLIVPVFPRGGVRGYVLTSDGAHGAPKDFLSRVSSSARTGHDLVRKLLNVSDALGGLDNATALFMPAVPQRNPADYSGPSIFLLSATGEAQVSFAPPFSIDEREAPQRESVNLSVEQSAVEEAQRLSERLGGHGRSSKGKSKPKPKTKKNEGRLPVAEPDPALPLEDSPPVVRVHFPEDGGDNS